MNILAFAGSNSSTSINHDLVSYVATLVTEQSKDMNANADIEVIRLTEYASPMYDIDVEQNEGIPQPTQQLADKIAEADKLIISVAEHNGSPTAFFKSHIDWLSRHERNFLADKQILLLSTSPGQGGGANALGITKTMLPFFGGEVVDTLSVGGFYDVFADGEITDDRINVELKEKVQGLIGA